MLQSFNSDLTSVEANILSGMYGVILNAVKDPEVRPIGEPLVIPIAEKIAGAEMNGEATFFLEGSFGSFNFDVGLIITPQIAIEAGQVALRALVALRRGFRANGTNFQHHLIAGPWLWHNFTVNGRWDVTYTFRRGF